MRCQKCGTENLEGSKFCQECGVKLEQKCPKCGAFLPLTVKFCPECGSSMISGKTAGSSIVGDKNVIGGDVIGSKDTYNITGNVTFLNGDNDAELTCEICGKAINKKSSHKCPKCGKTVCSNCFDDKNKCCNNCTYKVGDLGPAGGYVFYDKGSYSDGWRFLEVSPEDLPSREEPFYDQQEDGFFFGSLEDPKTGDWLYINKSSEYRAENCTKTELGTGLENTKLINKVFGKAIQMQVPNPEVDTDDPDFLWDGSDLISVTIFNYAAKACSLYDYNGYCDWFLPSADELEEMYYSICKKGLVDFGKKCYLSSSESPSTCGEICAIYMDPNMKDPTAAHCTCNEIYSVRPIRRF